MPIKGDMIGRIRRRSREVRDHAVDVGTENVVLKGSLKSTEFAVELLKRERDALRAIVKGQKRENAVLWILVALGLVVTVGLAATVSVMNGWW